MESQRKLTGCVVALAAAILMLGAVSAAQAFKPEWGKCEATGGSGGRYEDAACTVKAKKHKGVYGGGYEWTQLEGFDQSAEGELTMSGEIAFETAAGKRIACERMRHSSVAELIGPSGAGTPRWQFAECGSEGRECATQFEEEGEIDNILQREQEEEGKGWHPKLGIISGKHEPTPVVGMAYAPVERERLLSPIICEGAIGTIWIGGAPHGPNSVISVIEPVNQMSGAYTETFSQSSPGQETPVRFEDGRKAGLEAFLENRWEPVSMTANFSYTLETPIELKATK